VKLKTKMLIDAAVAVPVAWGFNLAARALGAVAHRNHVVVDEEVRSIAVAKLLGMGSIIQATPLLRALRARFPNAEILFITTASQRALVERLDLVDRAVYIDDRSLPGLALGVAHTVSELLKRRIDLYYDLEVYSAATSILGLVGLARNRYGFYRTTARFKKGIFTHLVYFNVRMPVSRIYLQLNLASGGPPAEAGSFGPLSIRDGDREGALAKLADAGVGPDAEYLVINPNASDLLLERRWPKEHFVEAIRQLTELGHRIVLVGAPSEAAYVGDLVADLTPESRSRVVNTAGGLSLGELFAVISRARCVITNDTGPMHIAFALDRPTVCLFGPSDPNTYAIRRDNIEVIYQAVFCSPCAHELDQPPCAGNNVCMKRLSPDSVVQATLRLLDPSARAGSPTRRALPLWDDPAFYVDDNGRGLGIAARASLSDPAPAARSRDKPGGPAR
jgi:ADP-heptose:LPS heptosyltransferase